MWSWPISPIGWGIRVAVTTITIVGSFLPPAAGELSAEGAGLDCAPAAGDALACGAAADAFFGAPFPDGLALVACACTLELDAAWLAVPGGDLAENAFSAQTRVAQNTDTRRKRSRNELNARAMTTLVGRPSFRGETNRDAKKPGPARRTGHQADTL
jgi:hypothetical protein